MTDIVVKWEGDGLARIRFALDVLGSDGVKKAGARALNHTGDKVYTQVKRRIAEQTKAPVRALDQYGALRKVRANWTTMEYQIRSTGRGIPLKVFKAYQTKQGVSVFAWSRGRYLVKHAFMVASLGGNVFFRTSKKRLPIQKLTGASIPKELVKRYVDQEFQRIVNRELPTRVEHEVRVLTSGIVS